MTMYSKNLGGHGSQSPSGYAYEIWVEKNTKPHSGKLPLEAIGHRRKIHLLPSLEVNVGRFIFVLLSHNKGQQ